VQTGPELGPRSPTCSPPAPFAAFPAGHGQPEGVTQLKTAFRRHRLLFASIALGLSAFAVSYAAISSYVKSEPVVVAARDLEAFRKVAAGDVLIKEIPVKAVAPGYLKSLGDAIGRYTRSPVVKGQVLMLGHLIADKSEAGLSYDLPADGRAFFLPVPASRAMGGLVRPGERVDLISAARGSGNILDPRSEAFTLARGLLVLETVREATSGEFFGVAVLASPQECEAMAKCLENGNVYLSLVPRSAAAQVVGNAEVWPAK